MGYGTLNIGYQQIKDTATQILEKLKEVDGTGSGLDADLLDGKEASDFIAADGTTETKRRIPFKYGTSTPSIYPSEETGMIIGSEDYAPGFVTAVRPVIISASSLHNQAPRITVGKENGESLEQITVSVKSSIGEYPYTPKVDDSVVNKKYVDSRIQASTEDLEAGVSPLETGKIYLVYE